MKQLIFILFFPALLFSQGIEPFQIQGSPYQNGILKAITKVYDETVMDSVYLYQHSNISYSRIDSMIYQNDTLYVYTQDSIYKSEIISGGGGGDVSGSGAANKVAYWQSSDTLTYDTAFHWVPASKILGIGTTSPVGLGSSLHVHGGTFSTVNLTNSTTGQAGTDGSRIYTVGDSLYIANRENARIDIGTNNVTRMTITGAGRVGINNNNPLTTLDVGGEVTISSLDSDGSAPTTSGTTVKVVSDANGKLSFQTNNTGTVTSVGLTLGTTGTDVSVSGSPVTGSGTITLNIPTASASNTGKLSSTDWTTFNNKVGGSGTTNQFAYFSGSNTLTSSSVFSFNTHGVTLQKGTWNAFINGGNNTLSGTANAAIGSNQTLASLTSGANNVGIGNAAGFSNTTGSNNFYLGNIAGYSNVSSNNNVFLGSSSGYTVTGGDNCYIGGTAGYNAGASSATTAIGGFAGYGGGSSNVDIGFYAGFNSSGSFNTRIGRQAGQNASTSANNIYIGYAAGQGNTGSNNTIIGHLAGQTGDGSNNVFLGYTAGNTETGSNLLYIENTTSTSPLIGGNFSNDRVGINTAVGSIARTLHVTGEVRITDLTTDTPTQIVGADADGDLGAITVSTGLNLSGGNLTNSGDLSSTNELQTISTSGAAGNITLSNGGGTLNLNVNDADASTTNELQTLSFSTPNLSISSGNSVTLPVLPAGTSSHTLAYLSGTWTSSSFLKNNSSNTSTGNSKRVTINDDISGESWPLSVHTATKFLVNGRVQMNSTASTAATSIMGRNDNMEVGNVTPGTNMDFTSGILSQKQVLGVLARNTSSSTFSTSSTPVKIDFNQPMVQINATANTSNDDIVTTVSNYGAYEITCDCQFNAGATATYNFGIYVNGSLNGALVKQIPMTSGNTHDVIITGYVSSLGTADEVDIRVSTGSGTSGNTVGRCMLALKGI